MRFELRSQSATTSLPERERVERRLHFALGRFADRIGRVDVWLSEEEGVHGKVEHRCLLGIELRPGPKIHAEAQGADPQASAATAGRRAARRVRDELLRRRLFEARPRAVFFADTAPESAPPTKTQEVSS